MRLLHCLVVRCLRLVFVIMLSHILVILCPFLVSSRSFCPFWSSAIFGQFLHLCAHFLLIWLFFCLFVNIFSKLCDFQTNIKFHFIQRLWLSGNLRPLCLCGPFSNLSVPISSKFLLSILPVQIIKKTQFIGHKERIL